MHLKKFSFKASMVVFLVSLTLLLTTSQVQAEDVCQLIRLKMTELGGKDRIVIIPEKITVPVGTCTVWINFVKTRILAVSFRENAKACIKGAEEVSGFELLELGEIEACYFSDPLPRGKTASITWGEPGVYKYTIEAPPLMGSRGTNPTRLPPPKTICSLTKRSSTMHR